MGMSIPNSSDSTFWLNRSKNTNRLLHKNIEKISSGYLVNRAADDAAGLAVSEKMRGILAGLNQGVKNINDGISYVHSVDGACQEIHNTLKRLQSIATQAANGTYDDNIDRRSLDCEYQQLIDEIDQMTDTMDFNGVPLFDKHEVVYSAFAGSAVHEEPIVIDGTNDILTINYRHDDMNKEYTIRLKHGVYLSPEELADEIDTDFYENAKDVIIGVNESKQFTLQVENGHINYITGSGSSLFFEEKPGYKGGYLLGVTDFASETARLEVRRGYNDVIQFYIGQDTNQKSITLDVDNATGSRYYTHSQLIDMINQKFQENGITEVRAVPDRNESGLRIIALECEEAITGLSGNFIKMGDAYHSPIYDIASYASVDYKQSVVTGKVVLPGSFDVIRGRNDYFYITVDDYDSSSGPLKISLLDDGQNVEAFSPTDLVNRINDQLHNVHGVKATAKLTDAGTLQISSDQYGVKCNVDILENMAPSSYMLYDFFDKGVYNPLTPQISLSRFSHAQFVGYRDVRSSFGSSKMVFTDGVNDTLSFKVYTKDVKKEGTETPHTYTLDLDLAVGGNKTINSADELLTALNAALATAANNAGMPASAAAKLEFTYTNAGGISLSTKEALTDPQDAEITAITINQGASKAYTKLIAGNNYIYNASITQGNMVSIYVGGTNPNTGRALISQTVGKTTGTEYYTVDTVSASKLTGKYYEYGRLQYTTANGSTVPRQSQAGESHVGEYDDFPASITIEDFSSAFNASPSGCTRDFTFNFTMDGKSVRLTFNKGTSQDAAVRKIQDALGSTGTVRMDGNKLLIQSSSAGSQVKVSNVDGTLLTHGKTTINPMKDREGAVSNPAADSIIVPPSITVPNVASNLPKTFTSANNKFVFNNGKGSYTLLLDTSKTYNTAQDVVNELNRLIAAQNIANTTVKLTSDGKGFTIVGPTDSNSVTIDQNASTSLLGQTYHKTNAANADPDGKVRTAGTMLLSGIDSQLPFTPGSSNKTITIGFTTNGANDSLTVNLQEGRQYSGSDIANAITQAANAQGKKIMATFSGSGLLISTITKGDDQGRNSVNSFGGTTNLEKYKLTTDDTSQGKIIGDNYYTPAVLRNTGFSGLCSSSLPLTIDSTNNKISMTAGGATKTITLDSKTYTSAADFHRDVKAKLEAAFGSRIIVEDYDNRSLVIKTTNVGTGAGTQITVDTNNTTAPVFDRAAYTGGQYSYNQTDNRCYLTSRTAVNNVEINDWYTNHLEFDFVSSNGTSATIAFDIDAKDNADAQYIVDQLNAKFTDIGIENELFALRTADGKVTIKGVDPSNTRKISNFKGGLYDMVLGGIGYKNPVDVHTEVRGESPGTVTAYIIGRNELEPESDDELEIGKIIIYSGVNSGVTFDLTYKGNKELEYDPNTGTTSYKYPFEKKYTISFDIEGGSYTREELAAAIEKAGREAMSAYRDENGNSFPSEFFHASIGLSKIPNAAVDTSGISSDNKLVLWCSLPEDGTHDDVDLIIDGVRGSSAYRVFYAATRSPAPTTISGAADLSNGIIIDGTNNYLAFELNGVENSIYIPKGEYKNADELVKAMNREFRAKGVDIRVAAKKGHLMFHTTQDGQFTIRGMRGSGADAVFYGMQSRDTDKEIGIHVGRRTDSYIWYKKTRADDHLMRINTTGVTTVERALKAIERLQSADRVLSKWRALSGANENRSRHTLDRTNVYIENLTAAESGIRDLDVPEERAKMIKNQIVMQAQQALTSTITDNMKSVLNILT